MWCFTNRQEAWRNSLPAEIQWSGRQGREGGKLHVSQTAEVIFTFSRLVDKQVDQNKDSMFLYNLGSTKNVEHKMSEASAKETGELLNHRRKNSVDILNHHFHFRNHIR